MCYVCGGKCKQNSSEFAQSWDCRLVEHHSPAHEVTHWRQSSSACVYVGRETRASKCVQEITDTSRSGHSVIYLAGLSPGYISQC